MKKEFFEKVKANFDIDSTYGGPDLEIFGLAHNWHSYISQKITGYITGSILEVGAGIGSLTKIFLNGPFECDAQSWLCLEPDPIQRERLLQAVKTGDLPPICDVTNKSIYNLDRQSYFDTIIYIDVLEHIETDSEELSQASSLLKSGGRLIVLAPAHDWLFSELDRSAGHFRRYSRSSLIEIAPDDFYLIECIYLDSVGIFASMANRYLLRKNSPNNNQIKLWDNLIIPISRIIDPLTGYKLGKSILAVWKREV